MLRTLFLSPVFGDSGLVVDAFIVRAFLGTVGMVVGLELAGVLVGVAVVGVSVTIV